MTLVLKRVEKFRTSSTANSIQKNERSLSEVLSEVLSPKDYEKMVPIIQILEKSNAVTPSEAKHACGKSAATVRRYLKLLTSIGVVKAEGQTNNTIYQVVDEYGNSSCGL